MVWAGEIPAACYGLRIQIGRGLPARVGGVRIMEFPRVESHWAEASRNFFLGRSEVLRACVEQNRDMCRSTCLIFRRNRGTRYLIEGLNTSAPAFFRAPDPADGEARTSLTLSKVGRRARFEPALGCRSTEARGTPQGSPAQITCAVAVSSQALL